jgi:hypothetical protein
VLSALVVDPGYDVKKLRLSADGCVPFFDPAYEGCCPPPMCGSALCCTYVAFFNLLPSGPLWSFWKAAAISYFQYNDDPAQCPLLKDPSCPSLILHVVYCVQKLKMLTHTALWPAVRESNPATAVTTLDAHLERLRWEDCYRESCRTVLGDELTPYEIWSECGPVFCETTFSPELECAVKKGVAIALTRAQMGGILNVCFLNWVIEPLGAEIKPIYPPPGPSQGPLPGECDSMCAENVLFSICPTSDMIDGCGDGELCDADKPMPKIPAYHDRDCDRPAGLPERIYPAVLSAECIVRSMLPPSCKSQFKACC